MEKYYKISETDLRDLIYNYLKFAALESGGVDNWDWYGEALHDYLNTNEANGFYDLADQEMQSYEEVK